MKQILYEFISAIVLVAWFIGMIILMIAFGG